MFLTASTFQQSLLARSPLTPPPSGRSVSPCDPRFTGILAVVLAVCTLTSVSARQAVTKYVRYSLAGVTSYGILEGDRSAS